MASERIGYKPSTGVTLPTSTGHEPHAPAGLSLPACDLCCSSGYTFPREGVETPPPLAPSQLHSLRALAGHQQGRTLC